MTWSEARDRHPESWLLIEALEAHSEGDRREVDELAIVGVFSESPEAMRSYFSHHRAEPARELYVAHTSREHLDIEECRWAGIRTA